MAPHPLVNSINLISQKTMIDDSAISFFAINQVFCRHLKKILQNFFFYFKNKLLTINKYLGYLQINYD